MTKIRLKNLLFEPYINEDIIEKAVEKIAKKINCDFINKDCNQNPPIFISVLNGAYMFTSDLVKKLDFQAEIVFIKISSYSGLERSNEIKTILDVDIELKGRDVIILDEIIDSGNSIYHLKEEYLRRGAASVSAAALILKSNTVRKDLEVEYYGIDMKEDVFLVGYGLDYDQLGRTLGKIYALSEEN
ncbi:MAG: phosphoribosyltransferase family protein [Rikenellaceae bacterium]